MDDTHDHSQDDCQDPRPLMEVQVALSTLRCGLKGASLVTQEIIRQGEAGHRVRLTFKEDAGDDTTHDFLARGDVRLFVAAVLMLEGRGPIPHLCPVNLRKWARVVWVGVGSQLHARAQDGLDEDALMDGVVRVVMGVLDAGPSGPPPLSRPWQQQTQTLALHMARNLAYVGWTDTTASFVFSGGWISLEGSGLVGEEEEA